MTDEGKLRQQAERGERARRILDDDLVREAFEKIRADVLALWEQSPGEEHEGRHNAYLMIRLLNKLRVHFSQLVTTGNHARAELLRIESEKKRRGKNA